MFIPQVALIWCVPETRERKKRFFVLKLIGFLLMYGHGNCLSPRGRNCCCCKDNIIVRYADRLSPLLIFAPVKTNQVEVTYWDEDKFNSRVFNDTGNDEMTQAAAAATNGGGP